MPFFGEVSVVSFLTIDLLFKRRQVPFKGASSDTAVVVAVFCLQAARANAPSAIKGRNFILFELGFKKGIFFLTYKYNLHLCITNSKPQYVHCSSPFEVLKAEGSNFRLIFLQH